MAFERQGKIEKKISYSLFLNGPNVHFGSILFGAVIKVGTQNSSAHILCVKLIIPLIQTQE
ncbi:BAH_G0017390.mRNA.1.CDS.1 [Saccharomyces cerevisiae]|nr:SX2_G0036180.mRNA.1.CDS.1 [Saccharomyces cerevisiae]CAI4461433.1 BAG_1a_G0017490.mRNA.1.CDS.1 [Saccharomyces cerevisiae]CAI4466394.1 BAH_G0017390.mRNA.1.CDS.1 [Saccharomyces cerevisiae]CAI7116118.1 BAG_1a_G0017490.mRNA.1.CDS.1 [Saccharomyces cerevisiae]CAI7116123.1 BAH_G0017390.mRNA.1.CDS.1 [Saccharomyces cerevisiae]